MKHYVTFYFHCDYPDEYRVHCNESHPDYKKKIPSKFKGDVDHCLDIFQTPPKEWAIFWPKKWFKSIKDAEKHGRKVCHQPRKGIPMPYRFVVDHDGNSW